MRAWPACLPWPLAARLMVAAAVAAWLIVLAMLAVITRAA